MYSYRPLHMAVQKQGDQLEPTYSSSMRIQGVALGTYRKRWMIGRGGERGSGISVLMARQHDDDEYIIGQWLSIHFHDWRGYPHGVVANMFNNNNIIVSIVKPQSCYCLHFWTNAPLGKYYLHSHDLNSTLLFFLPDHWPNK